MRRMNTGTDRFAPASWLDPLGSWEAAAHWNSMAVDWLASGWKQWLELVTVWPALEPMATPADAPAALAASQAAPTRTTPRARSSLRTATSAARGATRAATHATAKGERKAKPAGSKRQAAKRPRG